MQISKSISQSASHSHTSSMQQLDDDPGCVTLPKVRCAFHPSEYITNFCICECCLLPLCPACVKVHTNEHVNIKKVSPQYQPITDLLEDIYGEVQGMLDRSHLQYKRVAELDAKVDAFRKTIQNKISSVKLSVLNEVEKYFAAVDDDLQDKINNMNYIKMLTQYKEQSKRAIVGLKNIEKCFNADNDKIMRVVIKYKGGQVRRELAEFEAGLNGFLKQVSNNFVSFAVRQDYKNVINACLDSIKRIEISDLKCLEPVPEINAKLREVYERTDSQNKKEIIKSIGGMLANSRVSKQKQNQDNQLKDISNQPSKISSSVMSRSGTPSKDSSHVRSTSKGKGLTLMKASHSFNTSCEMIKGPRAVNICQPLQFNRNSFVRRQG